MTNRIENARELLATCEAAGVSLWADAGRVRYSGAARVVDPLLPDIQRFKPSLLELLEFERREVLTLARARCARLRLERLTRALSNGGACRAIHATGRRLRREKPDFWRRLNASDRHELAVCLSLLEAGDVPTGEFCSNEEAGEEETR